MSAAKGEKPPVEDDRRITLRRESDVSMAGVLAVQVTVLREAVDNLSQKVDGFDETLSKYSSNQQEFFQKPVIQFLEKTDKLWLLLNHIADVTLIICKVIYDTGKKSAETVSGVIRWMAKNLMPIALLGIVIVAWIQHGAERAWEQLMKFFH